MGRVERRIYRRRRKRRRRMAVVLVLLVLAGGGWLLWRGGGFGAEVIRPEEPAEKTGFDRTVETREVTLTAETWYAIQTGVFSTQEAALARADDYTSRGAPGVVVQDGEKWRVFIACYGREEDASAVRRRLGESQQVETYLYAWQCPELKLRLTGMRGQLDLVEAGMTLLTSGASQLRDTAMLLDAGELTRQEAADNAHALSGQAELWMSTARSRFGAAMPELPDAMLHLLEQWQERMRGISASAGTAADQSAEIKQQAMKLYDDVISLRADIGA